MAATAVVLRHSDDRFAIGSVGVDLFFVISGFVMATVSIGRTPGQFLRNRFWRIFPVYWAVVLPLALFALASGESGPFNAIGSLLLWPRWFGWPAALLGVSWTLVYELAFYAAVASALWLRSWWPPLLLFVAAIAVRPFGGGALVSFFGSPIAIEFLFGWLIARLPKQADYGLPLLLIGLLWLAMFPSLWVEDFKLAQQWLGGWQRTVLWGIPAALIVYGCLANEERFRGRLVDNLLVLGAASYSIYLAHTLVTGHVVLWWPLEFVLATGAGLLLWALVERPLLGIRRQRQPRAPDAVAVAYEPSSRPL